MAIAVNSPRLKLVKGNRPHRQLQLPVVQLAYRAGETNRCPGCGRQHWHVGRLTAECAFCATALPIVKEGGER